MTGSVSQVSKTAHWTAIIGSIALAVCLVIGMGALAVVIVRDGNTTEVTTAIDGLIKILFGLALTFGSVVGGPQIVSALIGRFQNVTTGAISGENVPSPAPPTS